MGVRPSYQDAQRILGKVKPPFTAHLAGSILSINSPMIEVRFGRRTKVRCEFEPHQFAEFIAQLTEASKLWNFNSPSSPSRSPSNTEGTEPRSKSG